jgi:hypothetical protein
MRQALVGTSIVFEAAFHALSTEGLPTMLRSKCFLWWRTVRRLLRVDSTVCRRFSLSILVAPTVCIGALLGSFPVAAQTTTVFQEDFNGGFGNTWTSNSAQWPASGNTFVGAPTGSFSTVGTSQVYLMDTYFPKNQEYAGLLSQASIPASTTEVEARVNTLTQDLQHLDGLFSLSLIDSANPSNYLSFGFFSGNYSTTPLFDWGSSMGDSGETSFAYVSNTWYRFRLTQTSPNQVQVAIYDDTGRAELIGHTFSFSLADLGGSFNIGISQGVGIPYNPPARTGPYYAESAVNYVTAQATVPEPDSIALLLAGGLCLLGYGCRRRRSSREASQG